MERIGFKVPELPEVETIVRTLEKSLIHETILSFDFIYPKLMEETSLFSFDAILGATFCEFSRRGKYLIFGFDNGLYWILHLRMEGKFHIYQTEQAPTKHTHLVMHTNNYKIHYLDTRKFSRMTIVDNLESYFDTKKLGLEPFDQALTVSYFYSAIHHSKRKIKNVLLDQSIITGIGNIYADEILWECEIHPETRANRITRKEAAKIIDNCRIILNKAILAGGTTIRSYTSALNVTGRFQISLNAYGNVGLPCNRCGTPLKRVVVSGRSSIYCEKCQKVKQ